MPRARLDSPSHDPAARRGVPIVHRSTDEIVVVKPAGLAVETPRDPEADSLLRRIRDGGLDQPRLVHRLDAVACGLVLVAATRPAAAYYAGEIAARRWVKGYVARVAATPAVAARLVGSHKAYLKTVGRDARVVRAGGKPSFLDVIAAAPAPEPGGGSDVLVRLHTGRHHQIRAMLADVGAPLAGDTRYGGPPGSFYLEHAVLGVWPFGDGEWTVWTAPAHADRPAWNPAMAAAVDALVATARTAPPPRDPPR
jgi:23S rRNA pseudouridine1911/1915/1917 synthase